MPENPEKKTFKAVDFFGDLILGELYLKNVDM